MSEEVSALTPNEEAFFESGGQDDSGLNEQESSTEAKAEQQESEQQAEQAQPAPKPEKTVPLAALHQARMENKELRQRTERMEQTFNKLLERVQQGQQQQLPDPAQDPVGFIQLRDQQYQQELEALRGQMQQTQEQRQQQEQDLQFFSQVQSVESQYAAANPDYPDAARFLQQHIVEGFINQGYSQQEAIDRMYKQVRGMIQIATHMGMNPAQVGHTLAKSVGYAAKAPVDQNKVNAEKIAQINKGQVAAKSLSTQGGAGKAAITLEALAEMDPEEMEKHWDQIKKLM